MVPLFRHILYYSTLRSFVDLLVSVSSICLCEFLIVCLFVFLALVSFCLVALLKSELQDNVKGEEKAAAAFILCDTCRERNIGEEVDPEMGPY